MEINHQDLIHINSAIRAAAIAEDSPLNLVCFNDQKIYAGDGRWHYQADFFNIPQEWSGFGVKASLLADTVKSLGKTPWKIEYKDNQLVFDDQRGTSITLNTTDLSRYPQIPSIELNLSQQTWPAAVFQDYMKIVQYAAAKDDSRAALGCVAISRQGDKFGARATDGYRLASVGEFDNTKSLLIPRQALKLIESWGAVNEQDQISFSKVAPGTILASWIDPKQKRATRSILRLAGVPEKFPQIDLPLEKHHAVSDRDLLATMLKTSNLFRQQPVKLKLTSDGLVLRLHSPSQGTMKKTVELEQSTSGSKQATLNIDFLRSAVNALDADEINLRLSKDSACCFWQDDGLKSVHWIMPYKGGT